MTSIDNPSPLASIVENLTQSKSLLPSDLNTSLISKAKNKSNKISPHIFFFKNLWNPTTTPPDPFNYLHKISTSISNDVLQLLPQSPLITHNEIRAANQNSAPGLYELTPSFYISFSSIIPFLCQTFNNSYLQKTYLLPISRPHQINPKKNPIPQLFMTGALYSC